MKTASERKGILAAACLLAALAGGTAASSNDLCLKSPDGKEVTCTGNQTDGIASGISFSTPPANTLYVNSLTGPIQPATAGVEGSSFLNYTGSGVAVQSGTSQDNVVIVTNGSPAIGVLLWSQGTPSSFTYRPAITIYVPNAGASGGGAGGSVRGRGLLRLAAQHEAVLDEGAGAADSSRRATLPDLLGRVLAAAEERPLARREINSERTADSSGGS